MSSPVATSSCDVAAHVADAHHAVAALDIAFADDDHVRDSLELRIAHARLHAFAVTLVDGCAQSALAHIRGECPDGRHHFLAVVLNRDDRALHRREPQREMTRVMLEQDAEEALDGSEQRAMNHDRLLLRAGVIDEVQVETLRKLEIDLDRRHLPCAADGVARLHGDLRSVEGAATLVEHEFEVAALSGEAERVGRRLPLLHRADGFVLGPGRQLEVEVGEAEIAQQAEREVEQGDELVHHLLACAEDMRVVHRESANARSPWITPDFSYRYTLPNSNRRNGNSRYERILLR